MVFPVKTKKSKFDFSDWTTEKKTNAMLEIFENVNGRNAYLTDKQWTKIMKLIQAGADVNAQSKSGGQPLLYAVCLNETIMAKRMIDKGADVDACTNTRNNALAAAASLGDLDMIDLLLSTTPDPFVKDGEGRTPLQNAIDFERPQSIIDAFTKAQDAYPVEILKKGMPLKEKLSIRKFKPKV